MRRLLCQMIWLGCSTVSGWSFPLRDNEENPLCKVEVPATWVVDVSPPHSASSRDRRLQVILVSMPGEMSLDQWSQNFVKRHPEGARVVPDWLARQPAKRVELHDETLGYSVVWLSVRKGVAVMVCLRSAAKPAPENVRSFIQQSFRWLP